MNQRKLIRVIAIVLAVLLAGTAIFSAIISLAYAEEAAPSPGNRMTLTMEYLEEAQALRVSQRLVYLNASPRTLDRLLFYLPANLLRRLDALPYEGDALLEAFPSGYLPGGVELQSVTVNGEPADYGFQGEDECYLRVACELAPGEEAEFCFDYYLLLTENAAFLGVSDAGCRLSGFYFAPASLDGAGEFILNPPLSFTRWVDAPPLDITATLTLPANYLLAATGEEAVAEQEGSAEQASASSVERPADEVPAEADAGSGEQTATLGASGGREVRRWQVAAAGARDFTLCFGKRWREEKHATGSGVELRCLTNVRGIADDLLDVAQAAVEACEAWFGPCPAPQLDFVQADIAGGSLRGAGCLWLDEALLRDKAARNHAVRAFIAGQYFGERVSGRPVSNAWLNDALSEYLAYLLLEEAEGHDAYLAALNAHVVPALQHTIPGGLNVTSDASLLTAQEYQAVTLERGAAALHELRTALGREQLLAGLRRFYERGLSVDRLSELDLVSALNEAAGRDCRSLLTDCLFHIDEYVNQSIDWLD